MDVQSFAFDSPQGPGGLKLTAKRYRPLGVDQNETRFKAPEYGRALTLLLAHCVGSHKEQWEPTIEHLFRVQSGISESSSEAPRIIHEAWAVDWQNHGDGAVVNRGILQAPGRAPGVSLYDWADGLSDLAVKLTTGEIDGRRHKLVAIGHSAGATALTLSAHTLLPSLFYPLTEQPFAKHMHPYTALILVEPTLVTRKTFHITPEEHAARMDEMRFAVGMTKKRKWRWGSRREAGRYFGLRGKNARGCGEGGEGERDDEGEGRLPWAMWDQEVLRRLVEYELEPDVDDTSSSSNSPLQQGKTPPNTDGPVRLKCHPDQESASYPNTTPHHEGAEYIADLVKAKLPVHLVWGTRCDLVPEFIQDSLSDASEGRNVASVTKMEDTGHMVVQEQPRDLAVVLVKILQATFIDNGDSSGRAGVKPIVTTKL